MKVGVYLLRGNGGAMRTCPAMAAGATACGDEVELLTVDNYKEPCYDVAVFWGFVTPCQNILKAYRQLDKPVVFLDMGYWHRSDYYKVSINRRHPTAYFQDIEHDDSRRKMFGLEPKPFHRKTMGHILLAGMGAKSAWAEKEEPVESWERRTVAELRKYTDRKIIYRPKPSWAGATKIEGTSFSSNSQSLESVLQDCHAVVTHHSNVAVDGLVAGVPAFTNIGAAVPMATGFRLDDIERPYYPDDREQWLNDLAYCQWSLTEMRDGTCWRHLKEECLINPEDWTTTRKQVNKGVV